MQEERKKISTKEEREREKERRGLKGDFLLEYAKDLAYFENYV